jgi:hypothetical protein
VERNQANRAASQVKAHLVEKGISKEDKQTALVSMLSKKTMFAINLPLSKDAIWKQVQRSIKDVRVEESE